MKRIVLLLLIICALLANEANAHPQRGGRKNYGRTSSKVQKKLQQQSSYRRLEQVEKAKERAEWNRWLAEWERQRAEQEKVRRARLKGIKETERTKRNVLKLNIDTTSVSDFKKIRRRIEMMNSSEVNHNSEQSVVFPAFTLIHRFHNTELLNMLKPTGVSGLAAPTIPILIKPGEAENQQ